MVFEGFFWLFVKTDSLFLSSLGGIFLLLLLFWTKLHKKIVIAVRAKINCRHNTMQTENKFELNKGISI